MAILYGAIKLSVLNLFHIPSWQLYLFLIRFIR